MFGCFVDLGEGFNRVEDGLHGSGVELLVEDGFEVEVFDLAAAGEDAGALSVGRDKAAAVDLDLAVLADEAELDGEPEEAAHAFEFFVIGEAGAYLAVVLEEVSEDGVGVHGDMAEDVVEDIGLGCVFHGVAGAQPCGGGEHARGEHLEEGVGREETADGRGLPAGTGLETGTDLGEVREFVFLKADLVEAVEVLLTGVVAELGHSAADKLGPDGMLLWSVGGPVLFDEIWGGYLELALCQVQRRCCDSHEIPCEPLRPRKAYTFC